MVVSNEASEDEREEHEEGDNPGKKKKKTLWKTQKLVMPVQAQANT